MPSTPSPQGPVQGVPRATDYYVPPPANYAPVGSGAFIPPPMTTTHSSNPMEGDVFSWDFPTVSANPTPVSSGSGSGTPATPPPPSQGGNQGLGSAPGTRPGTGPYGDRNPPALQPTGPTDTPKPPHPSWAAPLFQQQQQMPQPSVMANDDAVNRIFHPNLGLNRAEGGPAEPEGPSDASMASATYKKSQGQFFHSGLVHSAVAGRTDRHPINVAAGAYVVPADIVSGVGEGNTMAGAQVLDAMRHQGPHGTTPLKSKGGGRGIPAPPEGAKLAQGGAADKNPTMIPLPPMPGPSNTPGGASVTQPMMSIDVGMKRGGRKHQPEDGDEEVPIIVAGGEFIYHPNDVKNFGGGDVHKGHDRLDKFVENVRKKLIETTKKLPGPKK